MKIKNSYILIILILSFIGCTNEEKTVSNNNSTDTIKSTMSIIDTAKSYPIEDNSVEDQYDETELNFIVSVAEGYNYDSLKTIAINAANLLKLRFDSLGRYYNSEKKSIVLPEADEDDIYAGGYIFRRSGEDFTSIEMNYAYIDTSIVNNEAELDKVRRDTTKMFVFAMMYTDKTRADSLTKILKKEFSSTKIIPAEIFMGCMH